MIESKYAHLLDVYRRNKLNRIENDGYKESRIDYINMRLSSIEKEVNNNRILIGKVIKYFCISYFSFSALLVIFGFYFMIIN